MCPSTLLTKGGSLRKCGRCCSQWIHMRPGKGPAPPSRWAKNPFNFFNPAFPNSLPLGISFEFTVWKMVQEVTYLHPYPRFWIIVLSCLRLFVAPCTVTRQAPLSTQFSRQYWSKLPFPSPEDLPNPGIEPVSLASPALAGGFFTRSDT